jgi:transposase
MSLNDALKIDQFNAEHLDATSEEVFIYGQLQNTDKTCPECGQEALKPHQYYQKRVRHLPMLNLPTYLVFERKDWICGCGKVFLERLDFQDIRSTFTCQYEEYIYRRCKGMTTEHVAQEEGLHWDTVARIFKKGSQNERKSTRRRGRGRVRATSSG